MVFENEKTWPNGLYDPIKQHWAEQTPSDGQLTTGRCAERLTRIRFQIPAFSQEKQSLRLILRQLQVRGRKEDEEDEKERPRISGENRHKRQLLLPLPMVLVNNLFKMRHQPEEAQWFILITFIFFSIYSKVNNYIM